jgi:hypothetical protein
MNKIELERRTKEFSLQLIHFLESLPKNYLGEALGRQLLKSGTSIGANQEAIGLCRRLSNCWPYLRRLDERQKDADDFKFKISKSEFRNPKSISSPSYEPEAHLYHDQFTNFGCQI